MAEREDIAVSRDDLAYLVIALEIAAEEIDTHRMNTRFTVECDPPFLNDEELAIISRVKALIDSKETG